MVTFDEVIKHYGITNLNPKTLTNTKTGKDFSFADENKKWVQLQIDYYNSNFTDLKKWQEFYIVVQHWYYNFCFKKWKKAPYQEEERLSRIYELSVDLTNKFLTTYKRRIEAVKYLRGQLESKDNCSFKVLKQNPKTESEQFKAIFQGYIGSLSTYAIGSSISTQDDECDSLSSMSEEYLDTLLSENKCLL